jgi:hypothetical protein
VKLRSVDVKLRTGGGMIIIGEEEVRLMGDEEEEVRLMGEELELLIDEEEEEDVRLRIGGGMIMIEEEEEEEEEEENGMFSLSNVSLRRVPFEIQSITV